MADNEWTDVLLAKNAVEEADNCGTLHWVADGVELLEYLRHEGTYQDMPQQPVKAPRPDLILIDLHMPRKSGLEALQEIRADLKLRAIPVIIMTSGAAPEDLSTCYDQGANSVIIKPLTYEKMVETMRVLCLYWVELARLPPHSAPS